jgi:hypothetical protein
VGAGGIALGGGLPDAGGDHIYYDNCNIYIYIYNCRNIYICLHTSFTSYPHFEQSLYLHCPHDPGRGSILPSAAEGVGRAKCGRPWALMGTDE